MNQNQGIFYCSPDFMIGLEDVRLWKRMGAVLKAKPNKYIKKENEEFVDTVTE